LLKDYPSKHGRQANSAKCFDLYSSDDLANLFEKYDPCASKEAWLIEDDYIKKCKSEIKKVQD